MRSAAFLVLLTLAATAAAAAEGYFSVREEEGRAWLIDPDGERFFSIGACVTNPQAYFAPDLGYAPYYLNILERYGSEAAWADATVDRLRAWGFNSLGAWSAPELFRGRIPYTTVLYLSGSAWLEGDFPDYYGDAFADRVAQVIAEQVAPRADDPELIGYFLDNEMRWGPDWRGASDLFAGYFAFPAESAGKRALIAFLRDRYDGDVAAFNRTWGTEIAAFDDLLAVTAVEPVSLIPARRADREAFLRRTAERFFAACHDAIRDADPNHLILGARFVSWTTPRAVAEAIAPYSDVVSVNHYMVAPAFVGPMGALRRLIDSLDPLPLLREFHETTGRPILISEWSIRAMDAGLPNTVPPDFFFVTVNTQAERADYFERVAREAFADGFIVGYHWFSYMDEPPEGRFDGENSNFGIVDNRDDPWETLTRRMAEVNADALVWPIPPGGDGDDDDRPAGDDDDTWPGDASGDPDSDAPGCG
jgi:hypothetical protein